MHGPEQSDIAIVPKKPANNAPRRAVEWAEGRAVTEGNMRPCHTYRTQSRARVSQALTRVRQAIDFPKMFRAPLCCYGTERFTVSRHENRDFTGSLGKMKQGTVDFRLQVRELGEVL